MSRRVLKLAIILAASSHAAGAQSRAPVEVTIPAKTYPAGRHAWVYVPRNYPAACASDCNLMIVFDGSMYLSDIPLPQMLDSLIAAKKIPPTVAVLFDNGDPPGRLEDLANSAKFARFAAEELLPWIQKNYRVSRLASRTILAGSSAGGLGAAYIAFRYPALFGNVISQSGAYWRGAEASNSPPYEWLTDQVMRSPRVNVRFFMDIGARETSGAIGGRAPSLLDANRHLNSAMKQKGYSVSYYEVPNGQHSPESWRLRLPVGIVYASQQ